MFYRLSSATPALLMAAGALAGDPIGPDVTVSSINGVDRISTRLDPILAYSIGTTSCNIGDQELNWSDEEPNPTDHPVIAQNMYRLKDGRLEQIGMSWVKHGFFALQDNLCGGGCIPAASGDFLGVGCSDPYSTTANSWQPSLGPRSQINPVTGEFPFPFSAPGGGGTISRRVQVALDDVLPDDNPGALYFAEGQYIAKDDAAADNAMNNASYRRITMSQFGRPTMEGTTVTQEPAIYAWRNHGNGLNVSDPSVIIEALDVPNDGRFHVISRAIDEGGGVFRYEYGVHNFNSERAASWVEVPVGDSTGISDVNFKDIDHHSGEPFDPTDWSSILGATSVVWESPETFNENENTNALRWGTLYNFWFRSTSPPEGGTLTLGLFKPGLAGDPDTMTATVVVPSSGGCVCDSDGNGQLTIADLLVFLGLWFDEDPAADYNASGDVTIADLLVFLDCFLTDAGCDL